MEDKIDWNKNFKKYRNKVIKEQTQKVMNLIPKLLDAYDDLPNDVKDDENLIELFNIIDEIEYISDTEDED